MNDFFCQENENSAETGSGDNTWQIIIADDEEDVHAITKLALKDIQFDGRKIQLISAYSASETIKMLDAYPETAIIFLDIVMEDDNSGLRVVDYIRNTINNHLIQIIIRSGNAINQLESELIEKYEINDYKDKSDLTVPKLYTSVISLLRAYRLNSSFNHLNETLAKELEEKKIVEKTLRESESKFRALTETTSSSIMIIQDCRFVYVNNAFCQLTGYSTEEIEKKNFWDFVHDDFKNTVKERGMDRQRGLDMPTKFEIVIQTKNTINRWIEYTATLIEYGNKPAILTTAFDFTERKLTESALKQSEQRLELALKGADLGMWDLDIPSGEFHGIYQWAKRVGYSSDELEPTIKSWLSLVHPDDIEGVRETFISHLKSELDTYDIEHRVRTKNGEWKWIQLSGKVVERNPDGHAIRATGTHRDITQKKEDEEKLKYLATHDLLTGLPNRIIFQDKLEYILLMAERHKKFAGILFIDLDGFKSINDSHGHDLGDVLLKNVAERLLECVRGIDIVSRIGGDEFTIILDDVKDHIFLTSITERIIKSISTPFNIQKKELIITASIGIAVYPHNGTEGRTLLKKADDAMYKAKANGKNNYQFYDNSFVSLVFHPEADDKS